MDYNEFSERIKAKYPQYKNMDNKELAQRMVAKYPQYSDVTFDETVKHSQPKGVNLTPSGIANKIGSSIGVGLASPFVAMRDEIPLQQAFTEGMQRAEEARTKDPLAKVQDFITDTAVYSALPILRGGGVARFAGNAAIQGGIPGALEGLKEGNAAGGFGTSTGIAAALQSIPIVGKPIGKAIQKGIENPNFQRGVSKTLEAFTSVPSDYSQLALEKELAGNSIFNKPFDVNTAYQPIETTLRNAKNILAKKYEPQKLYKPIEQKLLKAKDMLPSVESFAQEYNKLGNKAIEGMNVIKENAANKIADVLENLNNKEVANGGIQNAVNSVINRFGEGGVYNSAKRNAPRVTNFLNEVLPQEGLTLRDLHRIKNDLYDIGYQSAGAKEGTQAEVARGTAEQINNYLRGVAPEYAAPNDRYSLIMDVERGLDSENTIAKKIKEIGSEGNILSGLDGRLKDIDTLLPNQNKFYKQAQELIKNENKIKDIDSLTRGFERNPQKLANVQDIQTINALNNLENTTGIKFMDDVNAIQQEINRAQEINKTIGREYERNPRLLGNRSDLRFEQALDDLQNETGIKFMDDLKRIRAQEAFNNLFPGQGGGSGSAQGFGNLLRTSIIGGAPTAAAITGNPVSLLGLAAISPKMAGKGTIRNLGKIYQAAGREIPESVRRLLTPLAIKGAVPMLYGGINND